MNKVIHTKYDKLNNLHLVSTYITVDINNQDYFIIKDFKPTLYRGYNSFKIDIDLDKFKLNTQIKIQIVDTNNNTIFIYYYPVIIDSSRLVTIYVDKQVAQGSALLTILGILNDNIVPSQWYGKSNIKLQTVMTVNHFDINSSPLYFLNQPIVYVNQQRMQFKSPTFSSARQNNVSGTCYGKFDNYNKLYKIQINPAQLDLSSIQQATTIYIDKYNYTGSIVSSSNNSIYVNNPVIDQKYTLINISKEQYTLKYLQKIQSQQNTYNYKSFININISYQIISGVLGQIKV